MFKVTTTTESANHTETFTQTFKTAAEVEQHKQDVRQAAPQGSTNTFKVERV